MWLEKIKMSYRSYDWFTKTTVNYWINTWIEHDGRRPTNWIVSPYLEDQEYNNTSYPNNPYIVEVNRILDTWGTVWFWYSEDDWRTTYTLYWLRKWSINYLWFQVVDWQIRGTETFNWKWKIYYNWGSLKPLSDLKKRLRISDTGLNSIGGTYYYWNNYIDGYLYSKSIFYLWSWVVFDDSWKYFISNWGQEVLYSWWTIYINWEVSSEYLWAKYPWKIEEVVYGIYFHKDTHQIFWDKEGKYRYSNGHIEEKYFDESVKYWYIQSERDWKSSDLCNKINAYNPNSNVQWYCDWTWESDGWMPSEPYKNNILSEITSNWRRNRSWAYWKIETKIEKWRVFK